MSCRSIETDKAFSAIYFNMARYNIYKTFRHISLQLRLDEPEEGQLAQSDLMKKLKCSTAALERDRIIERIDKHFPFLSLYYNEIQKDISVDLAKKYHYVLELFINQINNRRNYYTHYYYDELYDKCKKEEEEIGEILNKIFDASVNKAKDRFSLDERNVKHLRRKVKNTSGNRNKKTMDNPCFHHKFLENQELSEKGLAFLVSLFLEKKYIYRFLKQLEGFKSSRSPGEKATLESYCIYRIRLPKMQVDSADSEDALALDMLEELYRCPKELFPLLEKDNQDKFRVSIQTEEMADETEVLRMRYGDRFPFFALRWFDIKKEFSSLRFHVDLGRYYYEFYEKYLIDGSKEKRSLSKKLLAFGRPDELNKKKKDEWKDKILEGYNLSGNESKPYITDAKAHYHIEDNQVGIMFSSTSAKEDKRPVDKLPEIDFSGKKPRGISSKPDAWLSVYDLPAMVFCTILKGGEETEKIIKEYVCNARSLFHDISEGKFPKGESCGIKAEHIPRRIADYLDGKSGDLPKYQLEKLERMIQDSLKKLNKAKSINHRSKDAGKKKASRLKAGNLAQELAKDILFLQESCSGEEGKDKITAVNYQALQANLAFYGREKERLPDILSRAGILKSSNAHPFLDKLKKGVAGYGSILDFYIAYYEERKKFLENCKNEKDLKHHFLKPRRSRHKGSDENSILCLAKKLSTTEPVNLPRGLFLPALRENKELKEFCRGKSVNTVYLVGEYYKMLCSLDKPHQNYYEWKKVHFLETKIFNYRKGKQIPKNSLRNSICHGPELKEAIDALSDNPEVKETTKKNLQKNYRIMKNTEKKLRLIKIQDVLLFLMAGKIIDLDNSKLYDIAPDSDKSILSLTKPMLVSLTVNVENENIKVKVENFKIKNYGVIKALQYDKRVRRIAEWYGSLNIDKSIIDKSIIDKELEKYEELRESVFECFHEFEKAMLDAFPDKFPRDRKYYNFGEICKHFKKKVSNQNPLPSYMVKFRNQFCHNSYPFREIFEEVIRGDRNEEKTIIEDVVERVTRQFYDAIDDVNRFVEKK